MKNYVRDVIVGRLSLDKFRVVGSTFEGDTELGKCFLGGYIDSFMRKYFFCLKTKHFKDNEKAIKQLYWREFVCMYIGDGPKERACEQWNMFSYIEENQGRQEPFIWFGWEGKIYSEEINF